MDLKFGKDSDYYNVETELKMGRDIIKEELWDVAVVQWRKSHQLNCMVVIEIEKGGGVKIPEI